MGSPWPGMGFEARSLDQERAGLSTTHGLYLRVILSQAPGSFLEDSQMSLCGGLGSLIFFFFFSEETLCLSLARAQCAGHWRKGGSGWRFPHCPPSIPHLPWPQEAFCAPGPGLWVLLSSTGWGQPALRIVKLPPTLETSAKTELPRHNCQVQSSSCRFWGHMRSKRPGPTLPDPVFEASWPFSLSAGVGKEACFFLFFFF